MNFSRTVIYCRVSTEGQSDNYSLPEQEKMCRERAQERGYEVVGVVKETHSGAAIDRPAMRQVLGMAQAGDFEVLLMSDLDRFARSTEAQVLLKRELQDCGIRIEYVLKDFADNAEGRLMENIYVALAEHERELFRMRSMRGRYARARSGVPLGMPIARYGYDYIPGEHDAQLVIKEAEAEVVRYIYDLYVEEKLSQNKITYRLNEEGIPSKTGGKWSTSMIYKILTEEVYIGRYYYGRTRSENGRVIKQPRSEWIRVSVPAIIDENLFEAAQQRRQRRQRDNPRNKKHDFLVSGRIQCGCCGMSMHANMSNSAHTKKNGEVSHYYYKAYRCHRSTRQGQIPDDAEPCANRVNGEQVDNAVWDFIYGLISEPQAMAQAVAQAQSQKTQDRDRDQKRIDRIEEELAQIERQRSKLLDVLMGSDDVTADAVRGRLNDLAKREAALSRERERLVDQLSANPSHIDLSELTLLCERLLQYDTIGPKAQRKIIELLDVEVAYRESVLLLRCLLPGVYVGITHKIGIL